MATDTTFWFGFKDDVAVRNRAEQAEPRRCWRWSLSIVVAAACRDLNVPCRIRKYPARSRRVGRVHRVTASCTVPSSACRRTMTVSSGQGPDMETVVSASSMRQVPMVKRRQGGPRIKCQIAVGATETVNTGILRSWFRV